MNLSYTSHFSEKVRLLSEFKNPVPSGKYLLFQTLKIYENLQFSERISLFIFLRYFEELKFILNLLNKCSKMQEKSEFLERFHRILKFR